MSEGLGPRARAALDALRSGRVGNADGWYRIGMMENVGWKTIRELMGVEELEFEGLPSGASRGYWATRKVRVRFRPAEEKCLAPVGDDRVVVLLAEILAVLRDRL